DKRDVSLRWLGASVLTGLTGAGLIGASIYIALQGATTSATPPEPVSAPILRTAEQSERMSNTARKGDKLDRTENTVLARQSFRAPMTIRSGDREAIKV